MEIGNVFATCADEEDIVHTHRHDDALQTVCAQHLARTCGSQPLLGLEGEGLFCARAHQFSGFAGWPRGVLVDWKCFVTFKDAGCRQCAKVDSSALTGNSKYSCGFYSVFETTCEA